MNEAAAPAAVPKVDERYLASRRVTLVGAGINIVLAALKVALGFIGQSQALVADGIHSLSDLITDALVLYASKHGSRDADESHPYGHARFETIATVGVGILLITVAAGLAYDAVDRLFAPEELLHPTVLALGAAIVSVLAKEGLTQYTLFVARKIRSKLLQANAWHHRSDAVSSLVVIVGIGGTMAGLEYLDAIAAVAVAVMIGKMGVELSWQSLHELSDAGLDPNRLREIRQRIRRIEGVKALHMLRTRRMGANALIDVHILVNPKVSVSEGHLIGEQVRRVLITDFEEVTDVTVHIDPEDDEVSPVATDLPMREEMQERLRTLWRATGVDDRIDRITLHYLDGEIHVEVCLPLDSAASVESARQLAAELTRIAQQEADIGKVDVYFH